MPIKAEQLATALTNAHHHFLVTGDEPLLAMEAQDLIRKQVRQAGVSERQLYDVGRGFDFASLNVAADNFSLFAEKKLIELRFDKLPDKGQQDKLAELLANPDEDTYWLITCPKMDKRQLGKSWVKAIDANGLVVQIWPVAGYQLASWIQQRAQQMQLRLGSEAAQLLASRSEGNLLAAKQDLDKLQLLYDDQNINTDEVLAAVANNARYSTFELIDTALSGNHEKAGRILRQLQDEGVASVILVSAVYRECRQLASMSQAMASGISVNEVMNQFRVWRTRSRLLSTALQRVPPAAWNRIVVRCAHLDKVAKGQAVGNVWDELMTCLLLMGGTPLWRKIS
ncbi:DNA polymerase III subunit delta [Pleionea sp. CnH1-48]|uniref:DNA polymerase III subunit delta n=1 Tax=Pleionea sp. CnH1-48 TaxID=2954494 RepID=UPI0020975099|nr:DNA polymerase III subunit delta [Pleionea sp. CnH1-48]MCO7227384.1 DNA polymerase III subunit delta [Pleionea sp. CnH1-48]